MDGKITEAEEYFSRALSQNPDSARAHYSLAILLVDGPRSAEAVQHLEAALRINPRLPECITHWLVRLLVAATCAGPLTITRQRSNCVLRSTAPGIT